MNKLFFTLAFVLSACLQPVDDGGVGVLTDGGSPRDGGTTADAGTPDAGTTPDAGPVLYGLAKHDCAPTDGPAWQFYLSTSPVSCTTPVSEGFYVNLWTGQLEARSYSLPAEGSACLCGALGDTSTSGTVTIETASDAAVGGRIDATFHSGAVRHEAFELIVCPGTPLCG